jgi:ADP-ribosyl-[dinitrogen reductase] hydrolase
MNSMLGALVGDAAGATLEFYSGKITDKIALNAMKMPGGGAIRVGPGQITDDGELTITLWRSLNSSKINNIDPTIILIKGYSDWYESAPFDIGRTCSIAFETYYDFFNGPSLYTLQDCKNIVNNLNKSSEANGALMRATAIATWAANISDSTSNYIELGITYAKEDAELSHPSIVCQEVNAIYVFAIIHLLRGKTPQDTLLLTNGFVSTKITSDKVKTWYFEESLDISLLNAKNQIGHVRWGFVMAFYFLRHPTISYEEAIKITLMKGGDTDTNAAIVGGMVGAYNTIPEYMLRPVLEFDSTINYIRCRKRPIEYNVKYVIDH